MSSSRIKNIVLSAAIAQIVGTLLALGAAIYLVGDILYQKSQSVNSTQQSESFNSTLVWVIGAPPVLVALVCAVIMLCLHNAVEDTVRVWIKRILFVDAVLLLLIVYATGGVEGNIFSPIFFLIPVCSVALLKYWHDETGTIRVLVGVTIGCHLVSALLHKVFPIGPPLQCTPWATWIILYVCVILSVWLSLKNVSYANVDASPAI